MEIANACQSVWVKNHFGTEEERIYGFEPHRSTIGHQDGPHLRLYSTRCDSPYLIFSRSLCHHKHPLTFHNRLLEFVMLHRSLTLSLKKIVAIRFDLTIGRFSFVSSARTHGSAEVRLRRFAISSMGGLVVWPIAIGIRSQIIESFFVERGRVTQPIEI